MTILRTLSAYSIIQLILLSSLNAQPRYNHPELKWNTIETAHFTVTYHEGLENSAKRVAKIAEEIYGPITELYDHEPENPVRFIVQDTDDISNGAAYFYDNKIIIWALPMDYDMRGTHNWLRDVVTHEFTHIVSMQAAMKFNRKLPAFYLQWFRYEKEQRDDVVRGFPNAVVSYPYSGLTTPLWFAEGIAQYNSEKLQYDHWDSHRDMILRERTLSNSLLSFDDMAVFGKTGTGNEGVYNQGYSFVSYVARTYGAKSLSGIAKALSSRRPVTISNAIKKATGVSGDEVYDNWKSELEETYRSKTLLLSANLVRGKLINAAGSANFFPSWSTDGEQLAFISNKGNDYLSQTNLYLYSKKSGKIKKIASGVQSSPSWSPDGKKVVYGKISKPDKHGSTYFDLYEYDTEMKKNERLTTGERSRYPVYSPDGKSIAFVSTRDGESIIMLYNVVSKNVKELIRFKEIRQVYKLDWSPDGTALLFETSTYNGRDIAEVNSDGSGFRFILKTAADERHPVYSKDNMNIYFSSDRTGIFNIYTYDRETAELKQLTNVRGGAFMPSESPGGTVAYSEYSINGYKIMLLEELEEVSADKSVYNSGYLRDLPTIDYDQNNSPEYEAKKYETTHSTIFFLPRMMIDYGTLKLGGYIFSNELLNKISILGGGAINRRGDYDLYLRLDYNHLAPNLFIEAYGISQNVEDSIEIAFKKTPVDIKFNLLEVSPGMTFFKGEKDDITLRFSYSRYSATQIGFLELDNNAGFAKFSAGYNYFIGRNLSVNWKRDGTYRSSKSYIARDKGLKWNLSYNQKWDKFIVAFSRNENFGTTKDIFEPYNYYQLDLEIDKYFRLPFKSALALNIDGGYISKDVVDFLYYFGGGLLGMKGYSFYSIEGERKAIGSASVNMPIIKNVNKTLLNLYIRDVYGGLFFQYGNAWLGDVVFNDFKRTIGYSLRVGAYSFYAFPTAFEFQGAYGLDEFKDVNGISRGNEWKYYFTLLFDFL